MLKLVAVCSGVFTLAIALQSGEAVAQSSTNCMAMGSNMVHCDTTNMAPPTSTPPDYEGQRRLGEAMHRLIFGDPEKAFRMKLGKMLADGECNGAARLALESGRLELGQSISDTCRQQQGMALVSRRNPPTNEAPPEPLATESCTPDKIRYARSIGVDCHSLGERLPQR